MSGCSDKQVTVAEYLKFRLQQLECEHVFGVAGNYSAAFLNTIQEDPECPILISGNTNEINAGHCADGFARSTGKIAPVCVTYGVGAFSLLNPVAGSYVEHNPVLVINGAPEYAEQQKQRVQGLLYSHMTGDSQSNIRAYRDVTVAAEQIENAAQAPAKIDAVLNTMMSEGRPGYLEVYEDVWRKPCDAPTDCLQIRPHQGDIKSTELAVAAAMDMIRERGQPLFWAGIEIQRQKLQSTFENLVDTTQTPYMTSILAKSVLPENHAFFKGVYNGNATPEFQKSVFDNAGVRIGLGVWNTSKNLGGTSPWTAGMIMANNGGVQVGYHTKQEFGETVEVGSQYFANVTLSDFISGLTAAMLADPIVNSYAPTRAMSLKSSAQQSGELTYDSFFAAMDNYLRPAEHTVVVDAGFPLLGAQNLQIDRADGFISAAAWLSIGYSVPASLGVKFGQKDKRPLVFVGDGAFQETCNEISGHNFYKTNNVVFVLNNDIYGIEQMLVNPNPFRSDDDKVDYKTRPLQNTVYPYNVLHQWQYEKIVDVMGGKGFVVSTLDELHSVLANIDQLPNDNIVVRVKLPETSIPSSIEYRTYSKGEDEIPDQVPIQ